MLQFIKSYLLKKRLKQVGFKGLQFFAIAVAAVWLGFLLVANIYLNKKSFLVDRDDATVHVGSAFTWWPGIIRGRDLRVVVHDSHVQIDIHIDSFDVHLSLLDLLHKQLRTSKTHVSGVTFLMRNTRSLPELCKQEPGLPPISGQNLPPLDKSSKDCQGQSDSALKPGSPTPPEDLFRVILDGLILQDLREVWVEQYHLQGKGDLIGNWAFWPTQSMGLEIQSLVFQDATVLQDKSVLVKNLDLNLIGHLKPVQFKDLEKTEPWSAITLKSSLKLESFELKTIRNVILGFQPMAPPKFPELDGLSNIQTNLELEKGAVQHFSFQAQAGQASIHLLDRRIMGIMKLSLNLDQDIKKPGQLLLSKGSLQINNVQLQEDAGTKQWFKDTEIKITSHGSSFLNPISQQVHLNFSANISKSKFVIALIPGGLPHTLTDLLVSDNAVATAKGKLDVTSHHAKLENLQMEADELKLTGSVQFAPRLKGHLTASYLGISVDVPLETKP